MAAKERRPNRDGSEEVPRERRQFRRLLRTNPNYFGTLADVPFKAVLAKQADDTYEELTCVGYEPRRAELEATFAQKRGPGYGGGPCSTGSREYVRFFVDEGGGWIDAGLAGAQVTDLAPRDDCEGDSTHPLTHALTVGYSPDRWICMRPRFIRVRAILSWEQEPPAGVSGHVPVWGSVLESTIQIAPRPQLKLTDLFDKLKLIDLLELPDPLIAIVDQPIPIPQPPPPPLALLAKRYAEDQAVPPSRFAYAAAMDAASAPNMDVAAIKASYQQFKDLDLDLSGILSEVEDTAGDVRYEELECVALDNVRERLVGTYRVKLPSGFSGPLCEAGSKEYVAFWADWDDDCEWTYLGTASVAAHDFAELPDGGLCYSAVLPVDLDPLRRACEEPRVARIRAVLSWNVAPSTTDPDDLPVWGNRVDAHVRVMPGITGDTDEPATWITLIGGVNVTTSAATSGIDPTTGLTTANGVFADLGVMAGVGRPFGGWIVVRGPSLPGYQYRVWKRPLSGGWSPMTDGFRVTNQDGTLGPIITPLADGTVSYLPKAQNFTNLLGRFRPAGDEVWEIQVQVLGVGFSPVYRVQLDNTPPDVNLAITSGGGTCGKFPNIGTIEGVFDVDDLHLSRWSLTVPDPDPTDSFGVNPVAPSSGTTAQPPGTSWSLVTTGMRPCGYNLVLNAWDRTIRNSHAGSGNHAQTRAGFCLDT
ncbi:hypothetical protein [Nitriliruptor alkaliphilus]|uniref:hypothetical protein n=1 Tax=Nitriliruptor alkaliphilus TaxID=427918 RepID=UPI00069699E1|nr:hypothetical protein [Nitriliruptor alkaliphilus]